MAGFLSNLIKTAQGKSPEAGATQPSSEKKYDFRQKQKDSPPKSPSGSFWTKSDSWGKKPLEKEWIPQKELVEKFKESDFKLKGGPSEKWFGGEIEKRKETMAQEMFGGKSFVRKRDVEDSLKKLEKAMPWQKYEERKKTEEKIRALKTMLGPFGENIPKKKSSWFGGV